MVQEDFVQQVRAIEANALRRKTASKTQTQAEAYVREVKTKIRACFGRLPMKTSLNARIIGKSQPDTCGENQFLKPYGSDYFYAGHALMLDRLIWRNARMMCCV